MQAINNVFTTVIVKDNEITTALHFDYKEAEETLLGLMKNSFNPQSDDALIFLHQKEGEGYPVFNYRAYLNGEESIELPQGKENKHVKLFFNCPNCQSDEGKLQKDEDGDIVMVCKECKEAQIVFS